MAWKPNEETQNRVLYALRLMQTNGWGIERAATVAKTTRRTVRKYGELLGVKFKGKEGTALQFVGLPIQKIEDFLIKMHRGQSATQAAKDLKTTVRTMSKQTYKDNRLSRKKMEDGFRNLFPKKRLSCNFTDIFATHKGTFSVETM